MVRKNYSSLTIDLSLLVAFGPSENIAFILCIGPLNISRHFGVFEAEFLEASKFGALKFRLNPLPCLPLTAAHLCLSFTEHLQSHLLSNCASKYVKRIFLVGLDKILMKIKECT